MGFPLDDAWIHLVYGRSLARELSLAYNPGEPATGATSPLWAALLAAPHWLATTTYGVVTITRALGLACHLGAAYLTSAALAPFGPRRGPLALVATLVALNGSLLAASISGMETPLAALALAGVVAATVRGGHAALAITGALAVLARPELGILVITLPPALSLARGQPYLRPTVAASLGAFTAATWNIVRNLVASGRPLPATYYEKVGTSAMGFLEAQRRGFSDLLDQLPFTGSFWLVATILLALAVLRSTAARESRLAAAGVAGAVLFFATSFQLVAPIDPLAFYHQRYVLPALPLFLAGAAWLALHALSQVRQRTHRLVLGFALSIAALSEAAATTPERLQRLVNDTNNINDVQVAEGRHLVAAVPGTIVWAVDAGAIRYFGNAYVVDTMGLNVSKAYVRQRAVYLSEHPPSLLELVPGWSRTDPATAEHSQFQRFEVQTPYTVTSFPEMGLHVLATCPAGQSGTFSVARRTLPFTCAPSSPSLGAP